jgi:hypothetical protein
MRFDEFSEDDFAGSEPVPDGDNACEITGCSVKASRNDDRSWTVLTFKPLDSRYAAFEAWLNPREKRDAKKALSLVAALGLPEPVLVAENTVGEKVTVATVRASKDGQPVLNNEGVQRIYVNGFSAATAAAVARSSPPPKRTPLQKAKAAHADAGDGDDVPF